MTKKVICLLLLIGGGLFFGQKISAQGVTIGISPVTFELSANPGDVITNQLKVYNSSESIVTLQMEVEDIAPSGEEGHVKIDLSETETYSLHKWIKTDPEEFTLQPEEQKFINFTISVPENAEPGGHYGSVLAKTKAVSGPGVTGAAISQRVGALVLLSVSGTVNENLIVNSFTAPRYSEYGPIPFTIKFENKGTIHVRPVGFITITDLFGRKVADVPFPEKNILPGSIRKIETSWNQKWLWGGKYTATVFASYGANNNFNLTSVVINFWVFPWKIGIIILLIFLFFVLTRKRWTAAFRILIRGEKKS